MKKTDLYIEICYGEGLNLRIHATRDARHRMWEIVNVYVNQCRLLYIDLHKPLPFPAFCAQGLNLRIHATRGARHTMWEIVKVYVNQCRAIYLDLYKPAQISHILCLASRVACILPYQNNFYVQIFLLHFLSQVL